LVDSKDVDTMDTELENRLDDLFGENDRLAEDSGDPDAEAYYPLAELKNLILSIDWEITDEVLDKFLQQLSDLNLTYEHDKIVLTFLRILNSLAAYIKTNRAKAHPKTFKTLNSVFSSLDKVVLSRDMTEAAKKKMLRAEINRYKELRLQISKGKTGKRKFQPDRQNIEIAGAKASVKLSDAKKGQAPVADDHPEPCVVALPENTIAADQDPSPAALAQAVAEIKQYVHAEIQALKEELKSCL
jgi:hypothetical protein